MFLAEVVIGECCQGLKNMKTIPIKPGTNEAYDCAVDNLNNPSMYVVFKDSSAYAHYLLEYKQKNVSSCNYFVLKLFSAYTTSNKHTYLVNY